MDIDRQSAAVWASWFRCLADPSRVIVLNRLALARRPMSVGELVELLDVSQSTVSHHLKVLAETGFVLRESRGTSNLYRVNDRCIECFPSAAELIMGRLPRYKAPAAAPAPPWSAGDENRSHIRRGVRGHTAVEGDSRSKR